MPFSRFLALAVITAALAGCKSAPPPAVSSKTAKLQAQFDAMYEQWQKDCIYAPPKQIDATHAQCKEQGRQMDPVSQALQESEQADAAAMLRSR